MIGRKQHEQEYLPIWQCSEKVEIRALEKIKENKIRTFTSSPVEHSVALNRICLDMNNRFYNTNNQTWSFVGGNKFSGGFHRLWQRLKKHPNAFELDETAYDSSLFLRAMADMSDIRFQFLAENEKTIENANRLDNLYQSIIHSVIIMENGEITWKHTGNPSGSANTIVDNTIILFRLCAYAWIVLTEKLDREQEEMLSKTVNNPSVLNRVEEVAIVDYQYTGFMDNVEAALNGDDNTFTVSDKMVSIFNATTIAKVWSGIGVVTNTPNANFGQKVEDVMFLSQGFAKIRDMWLPKPETGKVLSSLMYNSDVDDVRWHLLRACGLRVDSWANEETRPIIQGYIEYLWDKYKVLFSQKQEIDFGGVKMNMEDIMNMWKSDEWIFKLYSNKECEISDSLAFAIQVNQTEEIISKSF